MKTTKFITTKRPLRDLFRPQAAQTIEDTPAPEEKPSKFEQELNEFNEWMNQAGRREADT